MDCVVEQQVCDEVHMGRSRGEDAFGVARRNRVECFSDLRFSGNFIRGRAKLSAENWSPIRVCDLISRPYQCDSPQHIAIEILGEAPVPYLSFTLRLVDKMALPCGNRRPIRHAIIVLLRDFRSCWRYGQTTLHIAAGRRLGMMATCSL